MTQQVISYIEEVYGVKPEYPFKSTPQNGIFRNPANGKWFAVLFQELPLEKLGVNSRDRADVLNLKCDPLLSFNVVDNERVFPGFHMNKEHWISVVLDGSLSMEELQMLISLSYELVSTGKKR